MLLSKSTKKPNKILLDSNIYKKIRVKCKNKNYQISINDSTCSCPDYSLNQVPCKHIFAARKFLNMPLFDSKIINKRRLKSTLSDPLPEANFQSNFSLQFSN